jgi:uncharacterized protein (TIGR03435 family)
MTSIQRPRKAFIAYILCSAIVSAMTAPATAAQSRQSAPTAKNAGNATSQKEFKFEVVAIHPLKRGFTPYDPAPAPVGNFAPSPTGFSSTLTVGQMMVMAYASGPGMNRSLVNMPNWFADWYYINARVADKDINAWRKQSNNHELLRLAMQAVLKERCKLAFHEKPSQLPVYDLVIGKKGLKIKASVPGSPRPQGGPLPSGGVRTIDVSGTEVSRMHFYGASIQDIVDLLNAFNPGHDVRDATGLTGRYDFTLERTPEPNPEDGVYMYPVDSLGLQIKTVMAPFTTYVIDHIEKPSPN